MKTIHPHHSPARIALTVILPAVLLIGMQCTDDAAEGTGEIDVRVACEGCTDADTVIAQVLEYETSAMVAGGPCCCPADTCSIQMSGIPYGSYKVSLMVPDSMYAVSGGADGDPREQGYYGGGGLVSSEDAAEAVELSAMHPEAVIRLGVSVE